MSVSFRHATRHPADSMTHGNGPKPARVLAVVIRFSVHSLIHPLPRQSQAKVQFRILSQLSDNAGNKLMKPTNKSESKPLTHAEQIAELAKLPRFSVETSLFIELSGMNVKDTDHAMVLLPAIQALRSELGRIVSNAGDKTGIAKVGKVGKDGERKVTIGKGVTTVKAGFVASLADTALWLADGVKRTGASLSVSGIAMAFSEKHPLRVAALEYIQSKVPGKNGNPAPEATPSESTPEPSEAPTA